MKVIAISRFYHTEDVTYRILTYTLRGKVILRFVTRFHADRSKTWRSSDWPRGLSNTSYIRCTEWGARQWKLHGPVSQGSYLRYHTTLVDEEMDNFQLFVTSERMARRLGSFDACHHLPLER